MKRNVIIVLAICVLAAALYMYKNISSKDAENKYIPAEDLTQIELIAEENREWIGKEMKAIDGAGVVITDANTENIQPGKEEPAKNNIEIPSNPIFSSVANDQCVPGTTIQEIALSENKTPEMIIPNGAMGIFSKGNSCGWTCKSGDSITWKSEKYPLDNPYNQTLGVGYIKDGVMHEMQIYKDSLNVDYQINIEEDGIYYIYIISASSSPISLKGGEIVIKEGEGQS